MSTREQRKRTGRGRRANYAPKAHSVGHRRYLPFGWPNWIGFVMFGAITVALLVEAVVALKDHRGLDPAAALLMAFAFAYLTYLFATNRLLDWDQ